MASEDEAGNFKDEVVRRSKLAPRASSRLTRMASYQSGSSFDDGGIPEEDEEEVVRLREENEKLLKALKDSQEKVKELETKSLEIQNIEENPNAAVRQIKAVERRLKVTEERLNRERTDRASKLSSVEEKLINENARMEVSENELKRKLSREASRVTSMEKRVKDLREENESLSISAMNSPPSSICVLNDDGSIRKTPLEMKIPEYKKASDEWNQLIKFINNEQKSDQLEEIIHNLWYEKDTAWKQLAIWESQLASLGSSREDITANLKKIAEDKTKLEQKIKSLETECEDYKAHVERAMKTMKERLAKMVKDKHETQAQMQILEDKMVAIKAERDSLKLGKSVEIEQIVEPQQWMPAPSKSPESSGRQTPVEEVVERPVTPVERPTTSTVAPSGSSAIIDEHIASLNQDLENNKKKIQLLKDENTRRQKELLGLQNELTTRIKEQRLANETNQKLTQEKNALKQKCEELGQEVAKMNEDMNRKSKDMAGVNFKYTQLEDEIKTAKLHLKLKVDECSKTDADLLEMKQILHYKDEEAQQLSSKLRDLGERVESADMVKESEVRTIREADERLISSLRAEIDNLKIRVEIADQNAVAYRDEKQKLQCEMQALGRRDAPDRRYNIFGFSSQIDSDSADSADKSPDYKDLHVRYLKLEATLRDLEAENARLKELLRKSELEVEKDIDTRSELGVNLSNQNVADAMEKLKQEREIAAARYCKTLSQLKSAELSLSHGNETREQLRKSLHELENAVEFLKSQVNRETASRKEAERRIENLLMELNGKSLTEDQMALSKANLVKAETDLVMERKAVDELSFEVENLRARTTAYETELKAMKRKLREKTMQYESLQTQMKDSKVSHESDVRNLSQSFSTKVSDAEKNERRKENENRQLKHELKSASDKLTAKGDEILRLKEELLSLQEKLSSAKNQVSANSNNNQMGEMMRMLEEIQNLKLEKEELVKAVQDARRRMATSTQTSTCASPDPSLATSNAHSREMKIRLEDLEAKLQTEKKLHLITQKQLKNIWQDNDSLRSRLADAKRSENRKETTKPNRADEINEIIARSQGQARCILGLGNDSGPPTPRNASRRNSIGHAQD